MYPVIDIIAAAGLFLASSPACPVMARPEIAVDTVRAETMINHRFSKQQLMEKKTDTDLPYQMHNMSHVETGGLMRGDIRVSYKIDYHEADMPEGSRCVMYDRISVTLGLVPEIFIASEYHPTSCWFEAIREHEESHIDMDKTIIEKYSARIRDGLDLAFASPGDAVSGPVTPADVQDLKNEMGRSVMQMVDVILRDMNAERHEKQQKVDSLRGYAYIMNTCYEGSNSFVVEDR